MQELKPCPFCGGEAKLIRKEIKGTEHCFIQCMECGGASGMFTVKAGLISPRAKVSDSYFSQVREAWNRRTDP